VPVPVTTLYKAWVCGSSVAGFVGSNPAGDIDVCICVLCVVRNRRLRRTNHSYRGVLQIVACLTECDRESSIMRRPWPTRAVVPRGIKFKHAHF
jgi:hypothetical protein